MRSHTACQLGSGVVSHLVQPGCLVIVDMGRPVYSPILRRLGCLVGPLPLHLPCRRVYHFVPPPWSHQPHHNQIFPLASPRSNIPHVPKQATRVREIESCAETGYRDDASSEIDVDSLTSPRLVVRPPSRLTISDRVRPRAVHPGCRVVKRLLRQLWPQPALLPSFRATGRLPCPPHLLVVVALPATQYPKTKLRFTQ